MTDIDIDFANRDDILKIIKHVPASITDKGVFKKHNTGVYCHEIPCNPLTNAASIDYKSAEDRGYFKLDFLNVNVYRSVKDEAHINALLSIEPVWELLGEKDICDQLVHVNGYHQLLAKLAPKSIDELAMVLALIRPGKRHLLERCQTQGFSSIKDEIWIKSDDSNYSFKHSHSVGYAHLIVMQLNLLCENLSYGYS